MRHIHVLHELTSSKIYKNTSWTEICITCTYYMSYIPASFIRILVEYRNASHARITWANFQQD